jgi:hypothetical protein
MIIRFLMFLIFFYFLFKLYRAYKIYRAIRHQMKSNVQKKASRHDGDIVDAEFREIKK